MLVSKTETQLVCVDNLVKSSARMEKPLRQRLFQYLGMEACDTNGNDGSAHLGQHCMLVSVPPRVAARTGLQLKGHTAGLKVPWEICHP